MLRAARPPNISDALISLKLSFLSVLTTQKRTKFKYYGISQWVYPQVKYCETRPLKPRPELKPMRENGSNNMDVLAYTHTDTVY